MKEKRIYQILLVVLIIILAFREGCNIKQTDELIANIAQYKTQAETYKTKLGLQISTNNALILKTDEQIKSLMATNDTLRNWIKDFRNIKAGVVVRETTIVKEVAVPFDRPIPCDFQPFPVKKITKDFEFYTTVANTGLTIDSLKIPNESKIVIGQKRSGLLGLKSEMVIDINNTNPYIQTSNISGYVYEPEKRWYEKFWVNLAIGAGVGYIGGQAIRRYLRKQNLTHKT